MPENKSEIVGEEIFRGGCLDAIVSVLSLGFCGVETKISYPRPIYPTRTYEENGNTYAVNDPNSVLMRAIETGEPVIVNNFRKANTPKLSRRIIRTR